MFPRNFTLLITYSVAKRLKNALTPNNFANSVILPKEQESVWLEADVLMENLLPLLHPYPAGQMQMYEISARVNRATEDVPEIIKPV